MHKGSSKFGEQPGMPHNGLANSTRPLPIARIQSDTSRSGAPSREEIECSAAAYAPQYAPQFSGHVNFVSGNPTETGRVPGRPVVRITNELRLHSALAEIGWTGEVEEINDALRAKSQSAFETILITTNGIILAGFGSWWLAMREAVREIHCIEHPFSDDEALSFIITYHLTRRRWNDFVRIRLALRQKPYLQQRALENMRAGGKYKGSANLPTADRIDIRQEIANIAGTGTRNVDKVETILQKVHPNIITALQHSRLSIHCAWKWCKLSKAEQKGEFERLEESRTRRQILREFSVMQFGPADRTRVIELLQKKEASQPGSLRIWRGRSIQTVITVGRDLDWNEELQKEFYLYD